MYSIFPLFSVFAPSYVHGQCFMISPTLLNIVCSSQKQWNSEMLVMRGFLEQRCLFYYDIGPTEWQRKAATPQIDRDSLWLITALEVPLSCSVVSRSDCYWSEQFAGLNACNCVNVSRVLLKREQSIKRITFNTISKHSIMRLVYRVV